jgi:hypothetical protein
VLEILDSAGRLVRRYSSSDEPEKVPARRYFAEEWLKPPAPLSSAAGHHRFVWDLRGPRPKAEQYEYSIAAIYGEDTPAEPEGVLVSPAIYTVRLSAGGKSLTQPLSVRQDPRVTASASDLSRQYELAARTAEEMNRAAGALAEIRALRKRLDTARKSAGSGESAKTIAALDAKAAAFEVTVAPRPGSGIEDSLARLSARLSGLLLAIESGDSAPTAQEVADSEALGQALEKRLADWNALKKEAAGSGLH